MKARNYTGIGIPYPGIRKPKDIPKGPKVPEAEIQAQAQEYLALIGVESFHLPAQTLNAAFHMRPMSGGEQWAARNASAQIKGFPDLILFYKGFYKAVELKSKAGILSNHQVKWLKRLDGDVCYSFDTFKRLVDAWKYNCDHLLTKLKESL